MEHEPGAVEQAALRDIAEIAKHDPMLAQSALAASAVAMARELDDPSNSATSKSMCTKALLDALDRLRELRPPEQKKDRVDRLAEQREKRLAAQNRGA